jgi:oligoribonuclease NrnB/cAMP/cGMP phosphodiesterase (DHH superfamily)
MNKPLIITHANCADGHCCKWLLANAFPDAEFHDGYYGRTPPDCAGRQVVIADFSYKRPDMDAIYAACEELVVLDHHKTAEAELAGFAGPKATVVFDMDKSGGRLTWEWLMRGMGEQFGFSHIPPASWLVDYTEDRDLWRWKLKDSQAVNAFVRSLPKTVEEWNTLSEAYSPADARTWTILVSAGAAILRAERQIADDHVRNARERVIAGHAVPVVNATTLFSEVAGALAEDKPFAACRFQRQDGLYQWSLRSRDGGLDVSEVAKQFGGGGHRNAAGFQSRTVEEVIGG